MTLVEFLAKVRSEPPRGIEPDVEVPRALLDEIRRSPSRRVGEILADPRFDFERPTLLTGHLLDEPVRPEDLAAWFAAWPDHRLPLDLIALLERVNGIHLWANLDDGRSYEGIAPLGEWQLARDAMWGPGAEPDLLSDRYIAISYHQDSAAFIVLNVDTGKYFVMDSCGADESCPIGASVGELLDWVWRHRMR